MENSNLVCIIEDNDPIRKLFTTLLQKRGFTVFGFGKAKDGIEWLKLNIPAVIVLDILLPDLNGMEAIKIIRQIDGFEKIPVVAVTGFAADTDKDKFINAGFNYYMTKPVNVATFAQEVKNCISSK